MGILTEDMKSLVEEQRLGYIATVCPDGTPNLSPKGTMRVWDEDHLVFAEICSPGTIENLQHNPSIEINMVDPFLRKGYRFKGTATILSHGEQYEQVAKFYSAGDHSQALVSLIRAYVLIQVQQALPLVSPGYTEGVTEDSMRRQWKNYFDGLNAKC